MPANLQSHAATLVGFQRGLLFFGQIDQFHLCKWLPWLKRDGNRLAGDIVAAYQPSAAHLQPS